jgi:hypothetical protein
MSNTPTQSELPIGPVTHEETCTINVSIVVVKRWTTGSASSVDGGLTDDPEVDGFKDYTIRSVVVDGKPVAKDPENTVCDTFDVLTDEKSAYSIVLDAGSY